MEKNRRKNKILMKGLQIYGTDQEIKEKVERLIKDNLNVNRKTGKVEKIAEKMLLVKMNNFEQKN